MTTQVPAVSAITFGQASHSSVRRIGPSSSAFFAGAAGGGSGRSSSSTGISATPRSDISAPRARIWFRGALLPSTAGVIPRAQGAMGACGIARQGPACPRSEREARPGSHLTGNSCRHHERLGRHRIGKATPPGNPAMRKNILLAICVGALALPLAACNDPKETATVAQTYGPSPTLPPPEHSWIPTVDIASVNRWPDGAKPTAANGMTVNAFATGLDHPRTVYVLPNGDVLVAESNAPPKQDVA